MAMLLKWQAPLQAVFLAVLPLFVLGPVIAQAVGKRLVARSGAPGSVGSGTTSSPPTPVAKPPADRFWRRVAVVALCFMLLVPGCTLLLFVPACSRYFTLERDGGQPEPQVFAEPADSSSALPPPSPVAPSRPTPPAPPLERR
jgi:hypothetical protein